jgi:hypothetical protein
MHENNFFCFIIFTIFQQKSGILILNLYLYSIQIQSSIREILRKIINFSKGFFFKFL